MAKEGGAYGPTRLVDARGLPQDTLDDQRRGFVYYSVSMPSVSLEKG